MPAAVDICNRALDDIGARSNITSLDESSASALACRRVYDPMRKLLLRAAPWGFARRQVFLTELGNATNGTSQFPWNFKYAYPSDCLKFRYTLIIPNGWPFPTTPTSPPQTGDTLLFPYFPACRRAEFIIGNDLVETNVSRKVILTNVCQAIGVYNFDCQDVSLFDDAFSEALVSMIAEKLVMPLTGNIGMKGQFNPIAKQRVNEALAMDGNEGVPTSDHSVDWIAVRGIAGGLWYGGLPQYGGMYTGSWDTISWGS